MPHVLNHVRLASLIAGLLVVTSLGCSQEPPSSTGRSTQSDTGDWRIDASPRSDGGSPLPSDADTPPARDTDSSDTTSGSGSDATSGGRDAGSDCERNGDCTGALICCPSVTGGSGTCKTDSSCRVPGGGQCKDGTDCGGDDVCCDFGVGKVCASSDRCPGDPNAQTCQSNRDCSGGDRCCPNLSGDGGTCESECRLNGGICNGDTECSGEATCCDIGIGNDQLCLPPNRCPGSDGGQSKPSCQDNGDCSGDRLCCPNLTGDGGTCESSCRIGGGICGDPSDCTSGRNCCSVQFVDTKYCLNRCP
jgi:hypothetical protein